MYPALRYGGVIAPVIVISTVGWAYFSTDMYVANWNVNNMPFGEAATNSIAMTLWAFLGLESACANADAVDNPEKNVPKAVLGGTLGVAVIYIVSTNMIFGIVPLQMNSLTVMHRLVWPLHPCLTV